MNFFESRDYRDAFQHIFELKRIKSKLSMRVFAQLIDLSPSTLNDLLKKKTNLSRPRLQLVLKKMKLSPAYQKHCTLIFDQMFQIDPHKKAILEKRILANQMGYEAKLVQEDHVSKILNWESFAIYEYLKTSNHRDAEAISRALGFSIEITQHTLHLLTIHNYVRKDKDGCFEAIQNRIVAQSAVDHKVFKEFHRRATERALVAIEQQEAKKRYSATELFAVDPELLPEIKNLTNDYLDRLQVIANRSKDKSNLYTIALSLFRTDHEN